MNVKGFEFPTFREWNEKYKREFETRLGDYNLHIRSFSFGSKTTTYRIGIACQENPLNIYSDPLFLKSHEYYHDDFNNLTALENWYVTVTKEADKAFKDYIVKTYCFPDTSSVLQSEKRGEIMGLCGFNNCDCECNRVECCRDCSDKEKCKVLCVEASNSNDCGWYIQTSESFIKDQQKEK